MSHGCGLKFIHEPLLLHRKSTNLAELALIQCLSPSRVPGYAGNPLKDGGGRLRTAGSRVMAPSTLRLMLAECVGFFLLVFFDAVRTSHYMIFKAN